MHPICSLVCASLSLAALAMAQSPSTPEAAATPQATSSPTKQDPAPEPPQGKKLLAKYHPQEGTVKVGTMAQVKLTTGWLWLADADGQRFLEDIGNDPDPSVLGVAVPPDFPKKEMFAVYTYDSVGHVKDDENPDYDQLLIDKKEGAKAQSEERKKAGLDSVEMLGWAEPPHYDKQQHKLYWAEKLHFGDNKGLTLNYNVRVLGRGGHLEVNGVGAMDQLAEVAARSKELLQLTEFVEGQRYENFDPKYDKVAEYGIAGLIAGGIAAKAGLFAKLLVLLKVAIKPILVGVVAIGAAIARVFTGRKKEVRTSRRRVGPTTETGPDAS